MATQPALTRRGSRSTFLSKLDLTVSPYVYVAPFFLLFALVGAFPIIFTIRVSMFDWHLLKGQGDFVGLRNYLDILGDPMFWNALGNTFSIFLLSAVPQLIMATILAALLDQALRASTFWRMGALLPYIVAPVAVAVVFGQIFSEHSGPIAGLLEMLGMSPIRWGYDVAPSHIAIASMVNWRWTGYNALILLAAMQAISRDLYEAAAIDGAGPVRRFFSITIPSIRPTLIFVIITATIGGLQIFTEPKLFDPATNGGANRQFQTIVLFLYELAFPRRDFGRAAATAWILFLIIVVIGILNYLITRAIATSDAPRAPRRVRRMSTRPSEEVGS